MSQTVRARAFASALVTTALVIGAAVSSAAAAEREQVRMVINLIAGVKMPFPQNLRSNQARTELVQLDTNGATVACLRLDDKIRWCFEHIAPVGNRAEMLRAAGARAGAAGRPALSICRRFRSRWHDRHW